MYECVSRVGMRSDSSDVGIGRNRTKLLKVKVTKQAWMVMKDVEVACFQGMETCTLHA